MNPISFFWIIFATIAFLIIFFDRKYKMLKDISAADKQPYSWSRVQLAWWILIVLTSFIAILFKYHIAPTLHESTLVLIGISSATIATAKVIDKSDEQTINSIRHQDTKSAGFFLDILSDENGVSIHRFQTIVFNLTFGIYFISYVLTQLPIKTVISLNPQNMVMPIIETNNLILLGLSSGTYAALKITENKQAVNNKVASNNTTATIDNNDPAIG